MNLTLLAFRSPLQGFYWINWLNLSHKRRKNKIIQNVEWYPDDQFVIIFKVQSILEIFLQLTDVPSWELLTLEKKSPVWVILTESDGDSDAGDGESPGHGKEVLV